MTDGHDVTEGSGNVFADLGLNNPEALLEIADLLHDLGHRIFQLRHIQAELLAEQLKGNRTIPSDEVARVIERADQVIAKNEGRLAKTLANQIGEHLNRAYELAGKLDGFLSEKQPGGNRE